MASLSKEEFSWDVAIVGAGIGGLTAGALLSRAGARVLICEQHIRPGGYCHSWSRSSRIAGERVTFTFDAAVHDISGAYRNGPVRTILGWLHLNDELEWRRLSHEYCLPSASFSVDDTPESFIAALQRHFPGEAAGIDHLFKIFRRSYDELYNYAAATGGLPRVPRNPEEMRKFREHCVTLSKFIGVPFVEMRDSLLRDPELRQIVSILSAYITDDIRQLSFANMLPLFGYYFRGGYYPRGGSQALADALVRAVTAGGGQVRLRAPVSRIEVLNNKVTGLMLADQTHVRAPVVISNADPGQTFQRLIDQGALSHRPEAGSVNFRPSNSAFMVYLALDFEPQIANSTFVLHDHDGVIISRPPFGSERAPAGYTTLTLTGLIDSADFHQWDRRAPGYAMRKRETGDRLIAFAARRIPEILRHIVFREEGSPATLQRYTWATVGAAYGSTPGTRWPGHKSPVQGLYLVGAATGLGSGIEAVMVGAASLAEELAGKPASIDCETKLTG